MHAEHCLLLKAFNARRCAPETMCVVHIRGAAGEYVHTACSCVKCRRMLLRSGVRRVLYTENGCADGAPYVLQKL